MGVPFIYHNPHRETVMTYAYPVGGFPVSTSSDDLAAAVRHVQAGTLHAHSSKEFLGRMVSLTDTPSHQRAAKALGFAVRG